MTLLKLHIIFIAFLFAYLGCAISVSAQKLQWVVNGGGTDIKTDKMGRVYVTGSFFTDSIKIGNITLKTTSSGNYTSYIVRYSPQGNVIWAKTTGRMVISRLGIDDNGYIYFAGGASLGKLDSLGNVSWLKTVAVNYRGYCLDKNGNSFFIGTNSNGMFCAAKYDSAGNAVWVKPYGTAGTGFIQNIQIGVDGLGNLYACDGVADYATIGKATYYNPYPANEGYSNYLFKISSAGNLVWSKYLNFDGGYGENIAVDTSGNIYMTATSRLGMYSFRAVFDTIVLTENNLNGGGETESITVKFDSIGRAVWARHIPGEFINGNGIGSSGLGGSPPIFLAPNGDIYIAGKFDGHIQFLNKPFYFDPYGGGEDFYAKYNNDGLEQGFITLGYIKKWTLNGGPSGPETNSIALDLNNNLYFTGGYEGDDLFDKYNLIATYGSMTGKLSAFPVIMPDSIGYTNNCSGVYQFTLYYNTTPDSVLWNFGDGTQSRRFQPSHTYLKTGTYIVKATAYVQGQVKSFADTVNFVHFPFNLLPKDTVLCFGASLNLNCTLSGATSYLWNDGTTQPKRTFTQAGFYKLTVSGGGCPQSDSFNLKYDNRSFNLGNDTTLCQGDSKILTGPSWQNVQYSWNTGNTTQNQTVNSPGLYSLSVYDGACHFYDSINIKYDLFPAKILPSDTVICDNRSIQGSIKNFSGTILWQPVPQNGSKTDSNYTITSAGAYSVTLTNQCGTRTYTSTVTDSNCECFIYVPNAFTPNQDHVNDLFLAQSGCTPENYTLQIYNRWGERVFQSNDIHSGWDGTNAYGWDGAYKQPYCPVGVYVYKILFKFPHNVEQEKTGTVTIN